MKFLSLSYFRLFALITIIPVSSYAIEEVSGTVTDIKKDGLTLRLSEYEATEQTEYSIGRGDADVWKRGDQIRGERIPYGEGHRLQTIWPDSTTAKGTLNVFEQRLRQDTKIRGSKAFRGIGEYMPKFALYDQFGEVFYSESLKGNYVVLNFIFTRCMMPNMCPAATLRMTQLQDLAAEAGIKNLMLVSITLDPEYDTPGIFNAYMKDKGIKPENFRLLGGSESIAEDLRIQLGVLAEKDPEQIIKHTLTTTLVDPTGKIIYRLPGSMWEPQIFLKQIKKDLKAD